MLLIIMRGPIIKLWESHAWLSKLLIIMCEGHYEITVSLNVQAMNLGSS
jgi:hypothetical protein